MGLGERVWGSWTRFSGAKAYPAPLDACEAPPCLLDALVDLGVADLVGEGETLEGEVQSFGRYWVEDGQA
ncbi:hypothetical protein [Frankia sp. CcWB3]